MTEHVTIAVIGNGGREHALVAAYAKSPHVGKILVFPGNDFMNSHISVITYPTLTTTSISEIVDECIKQHVSLVDVAQDDAVAAGLTNVLKKSQPNMAVVGPTKEAGQIEWDKNWSRTFMERAGILQPLFKTFTSVADGKQYIKEFFAKHPDKKLFVKAAGLALGKGAVPGETKKGALSAVDMVQKYGKTYLIEEWIEGDSGERGEEFSAFAVSDGTHWQLVGYAQDHKRAHDNDTGDNTGGMGCVSNPLLINKDIDEQVCTNFEKIFTQLRKEKRPYKGVLYFGGMVVKKKGKSVVYAVECNARWGDPEAEVITPSITNDFYELSMAIAQGKLNTIPIQTDGLTRVSIAGAAEGYPNAVFKGTDIFGLNEVDNSNVIVFGAGIRKKENGWVANGGRLFHIVGKGKNVIDARERAYAAINKIRFRGFFRKDIGYRDVARLSQEN